MAEQLEITLPDGSTKQVLAGTTVGEFVKTQIGSGLARAALYAKLAGGATFKPGDILPADRLHTKGTHTYVGGSHAAD